MTVLPAPRSRVALGAYSSQQVAAGLVCTAIGLTVLHYAGLLPAWLHRLPESWIPPFAEWLDVIFNFVRTDLGLEKLTRWFAEGPLQSMLDTTANLLYGKRRWPNFEPIPWSAIAASAAVLGYYLGGWRLAALAGGTFIWTALVGQWKIAMETMSVLMVAAPMAFALGLGLGIAAWKYAWLEVATVIYAIPPMILMTTLGLKKVSPEVVEAGKMSGCSRWQMLRHVYIPAARTDDDGQLQTGPLVRDWRDDRADRRDAGPLVESMGRQTAGAF